MTKILGLTTFLGLQKSTVGMLFMVILVGMGERMAERFLPIYLIALVLAVVAAAMQQKLIEEAPAGKKKRR